MIGVIMRVRAGVVHIFKALRRISNGMKNVAETWLLY